MTKFKVGDRVKLVKVGGSVPISFGYKVGDIASIVDPRDASSIVIKMDYGPEEERTLFVCSHEIEPAIRLTTPETIQHEGYNYTRGEPVVPEWVKDGAWVVTTKDGELIPDVLYQLVEQEDGFYTKGRSGYLGKITAVFINSFRPHEPSDYKWGDWAMYGGEKVFVMRREKEGYISVSHPDFNKGHGIVQVSELTPAHAP